MTPTPGPYAFRRAWIAPTLALLFLNASLTFANVWPTPRIRWEAALSVELAVLVLLVALVRRRMGRIGLTVLSMLWMLLVVGHYAGVTARGLYGRAFNLYWDSRHLSNVGAMLAGAAQNWTVVLALVSAAALLVALFLASRLAWRAVAAAVGRPSQRPVLVAVAAAVVVLFAGQYVLKGPPTELATERDAWTPRGFAAPVTPGWGRQIDFVLRMMGQDAQASTLPASPDTLRARLPALGGADVMLVFVESYGAVTYDAPTIAAGLAPSRTTMAAAIRDSGRQVVSSYVVSPTFGGSSWLAHLSLISGVHVGDQGAYERLMTEDRPSLVSAFSDNGYRTVALMPGTRQAWPEGAFYGFDTIYDRAALHYDGPEFGWWSIPDQWALARLDAFEPRPRAPLFAVFPTSTSHAPFSPVAPYVHDWSRLLTPTAWDQAEAERIIDEPPDWMDLRTSYTRAMAYDFESFAGYLRQREGDDLVMILIGDHQPPSAVSGTDAPWEVPVHVIASRADILDRLRAQGFRDGLLPQRPALGTMHQLVPVLLQAFGAPPSLAQASVGR